jgi:hypothetical protein
MCHLNISTIAAWTTYDTDKHNTNKKHVKKLKDDLFQKRTCFARVKFVSQVYLLLIGICA